MVTDLSPSKRCDPRSRGSNPTCAGPCSCRSRCQNPADGLGPKRGDVASADQQWAVTERPGSDTPGGGTFRPDRCARVPALPEASGPPLRPPHWRVYGYRQGTDIGCLVSSPGENGSVTVPVKSHGVPACRVRAAYKSLAKGRANVPERGRFPQSPPPQGWQQIRSRPLWAERRNRRERRKIGEHMRTVSPLATAAEAYPPSSGEPRGATARAGVTLRNTPKRLNDSISAVVTR
jgi:hypothetical protein